MSIGQRGMAWWLGTVLGAASVVVVVGWSAHDGVAATDAQSGAQRPVLVELFTSEGCSSCPPADVLLARLDSMQPVPGAQVIVLSEHVTYWDHEGWRDPYSLDSVTDRQKWYGFEFGLSDVYTPQAVVDGAVEVLGSDARKLVDAITAAATKPKDEMTIADATWTGDEIKFIVRRPDAPPAKSKKVLVVVLAEDVTETPVKGGENAGKTLRNVAVVRVLREFTPEAGGDQELTLKLPRDENLDAHGAMRLVVFLADKHSGHIEGAAEQSVSH